MRMQLRLEGTSSMWPMVALLTGLFLLLHPYHGLVHDSRIYTLQALNSLHPDLFGNDVYLKFGSQDKYTVFSPVYSSLISLLGVERAASFITLVSSLALLIGAWWLARSLMSARMAWLAVGVLLIIPGYYGPDEFFAVLEGFATPRLLAQALVLFALVALLRGRRLACAVLLGIALAVHPLMAAAGILLWLAISVADHWHQIWRWVLTLVLAGTVFTVLVLTNIVPISGWQFDPQWWPMVSREELLLLGKWSTDDWARFATIQATIVLAALTFDGAIRRIANGLLLASTAAMLLSFIGGDLLKITLVIQGQAWRAMWLATTVAALLLPAVAVRCWQGLPLRQASLLLLIGAWVLGHQPLALVLVSLSLLTAVCDITGWARRSGRLALLAAYVLVALAVLCRIAFMLTDLPSGEQHSRPFTWLHWLRAVSADQLLPTIVLLATWLMMTRMQSFGARLLLALGIAVPTALLASTAARPWMTEVYSREAMNAFASWRAMIPMQSDVLWAARVVPGSDPAGAWLLLERPSYYSSVQVNSALFSRAAAQELRRRHTVIPRRLYIEDTFDLTFSTAPALTCEMVPTRYVVTESRIEGAVVLEAPVGTPTPFSRLQLNVCP